MKEIEILVEVYSPVVEVIMALDKFEYLGNNEIIDTYYYDPLRKIKNLIQKIKLMNA